MGRANPGTEIKDNVMDKKLAAALLAGMLASGGDNNENSIPKSVECMACKPVEFDDEDAALAYAKRLAQIRSGDEFHCEYEDGTVEKFVFVEWAGKGLATCFMFNKQKKYLSPTNVPNAVMRI